MLKIVAKLLITSCTILGVTIEGSSAQANNPVEENNPTHGADAQTIWQNSGNEGAIAQVNSVFQFSDVSPTDWAFEALQNLVEVYGCIEGYPDQTYRGNRALTRYEFAAGLNSCLQKLAAEITVEPTGEVIIETEIEPVAYYDFAENLSEVFNLAFFEHTGDFYDAIEIESQINTIFGCQSFLEGSYPETQIARDAELINIIYQTALEQQVENGPPLRTPDLSNPFDTSIRFNPAYLRSIEQPVEREFVIEQVLP